VQGRGPPRRGVELAGPDRAQRRQQIGQGLARGGGGGQHHVGPGVGELSGLLLVDPGSGDPGFGQMFDQSRIAAGGEGALPGRAGRRSTWVRHPLRVSGWVRWDSSSSAWPARILHTPFAAGRTRPSGELPRSWCTIVAMSFDAPATPPRVRPDLVDALRADLVAADYTVTATQALLGEVAVAALRREDPVPARRVLTSRTEP